MKKWYSIITKMIWRIHYYALFMSHQIKSIFGMKYNFRIQFIQTKHARQNCNKSPKLIIYTVVNSDIIPHQK